MRGRLAAAASIVFGIVQSQDESVSASLKKCAQPSRAREPLDRRAFPRRTRQGEAASPPSLRATWIAQEADDAAPRQSQAGGHAQGLNRVLAGQLGISLCAKVDEFERTPRRQAQLRVEGRGRAVLRRAGEKAFVRKLTSPASNRTFAERDCCGVVENG